MLDVKADTSGMEEAIAAFARVANVELVEGMRKAGGTMVGQLIGVTPPSHQATLSGAGGVTLAAKKAGEARVASDISKLFPTTNIAEEKLEGMNAGGFKWLAANGRRYGVAEFAKSPADLARIHKAARNSRTGRTNAGYGANMAVTRSALRKAYIKQEIKKVGLLSAGWINAARDLKTPGRYLPTWITRHGAGPGGTQTMKSGGRVMIRISNSNDWFGSGWDRRLAYVISRGEKAMISATKNILEREARKAERRMGR